MKKLFLAIMTLGLLLDNNLYSKMTLKEVIKDYETRTKKKSEERKMFREECMTEAKSKSENPEKIFGFYKLCIAEKTDKAPQRDKTTCLSKANGKSKNPDKILAFYKICMIEKGHDIK